jgi:hypothetical protein
MLKQLLRQNTQLYSDNSPESKEVQRIADTERQALNI